MTRLRRRRDVNRPTFAAVAEDSLDEVYRYLLVLTADPALADDLTGATFEKALRSWRRYDPTRAEPVAWLCAIAFCNACWATRNRHSVNSAGSLRGTFSWVKAMEIACGDSSS